MSEPFDVKVQRAEGCLVVIYASFLSRDYRTLGAVVGPRTILTCGHTVWKPGTPDGSLLNLIVDDYPRRLSRASEIGRYRSRFVFSVPDAVLQEGIAALSFKEDYVIAERTARFWEDSIATLGPDSGRLGEPAYLLCEDGIRPWPCETGSGFSGAPVFNKDKLIGVHYGRRNFAPGSLSKASLNSEPLWIPLPEGRPWTTHSSVFPPASAARELAK